MRDFLTHFVSPYGRISRLGYLRASIFYFGGLFVSLMLLIYFGPFGGQYYEILDIDYCLFGDGIVFEVIVFWIVLYILMVPLFILTIRRFHDFGLSGWWYVLLYAMTTIFEFMMSVYLSLAEPSLELSYKIANYFGSVDCYPEFMSRLNVDFLHLSSWGYLYSFLISVFIPFFVRGIRGPNKYGPDPLEKK